MFGESQTLIYLHEGLISKWSLLISWHADPDAFFVDAFSVRWKTCSFMLSA